MARFLEGALLKISGVYVIANLRDGRVYVGASLDIGRRWKEHRAKLRAGRNEARRLQAAWTEQGPEAFVFAVLEVVYLDRPLLLEREEHWINQLGADWREFGYNGPGPRWRWFSDLIPLPPLRRVPPADL